MEDSAKAGGAPVLIENGKAIGPGLTAMNNDRTARIARRLELLDEDSLLNFARRMIVVIIEADFAPSEKFGLLRQSREFLVVCGRGKLRLMRVNARSGIDPVVALGKWQRRGQRAGSSSDGEDIAHSGRLSPRQHIHSIRIELRDVQVRMRIDEIELRRR